MPYCSTACRDEHRSGPRCLAVAALPEREGQLTEKFLAKPATRVHFAKHKQNSDGVLLCLLCGGREELGRSGAVLCRACHSDFVQGRRAKKKRPPPQFKIEEWISAEDMKVVEADRLERKRILQYLAEQKKWYAMIDEMCGGASEEIQERVYAVWDRTRNWELVVKSFDRLTRPVSKIEKVINTVCTAFSNMFTRTEPIKLREAPPARRRVRDGNVRVK
jgi:hypothetical protein